MSSFKQKKLSEISEQNLHILNQSHAVIEEKKR